MKKMGKLRRIGLLACAAVFVFSGAMLAHNLRTAGREQEAFRRLAAQVESAQQQQSTGGAQQAPSPYEGLAQQNGDLCGWVRIGNTAVDYPVMHTPQAPEYYLRRNFDGEYSVAGTPFLDARCDMENGSLLIVYGHNMNDGSMCGALKGYLDEAYRALHPVIRCDSLTQAREYEVLGVLRFKATQEAVDAYYTIPRSEAEFNQYLQRLQADAVYWSEADVRWGGQLLALSTCDSADSGSRVLVVAYRTENVLFRMEGES